MSNIAVILIKSEVLKLRTLSAAQHILRLSDPVYFISIVIFKGNDILAWAHDDVPHKLIP